MKADLLDDDSKIDLDNLYPLENHLEEGVKSKNIFQKFCIS